MSRNNLALAFILISALAVGVVGGCATPAGTEEAAKPAGIPGTTFRDRLRSGGEGPEMVVIPAGSFRMGCLSNDDDCDDNEKPVHEVTIPATFALSVYEVTFAHFDRFTSQNKLDDVDDHGRGRGSRPVTGVSWNYAKAYVAWLSSETGAEYRLPSEAEWEYAGRAGTETKYSWGNEIGVNRANCFRSCGDQWAGPAPVGSFGANAFGLYDMHGNAYEWVEDCKNRSYSGAPSDGSAWLGSSWTCRMRVLRGGGYTSRPRGLRAAHRYDSLGDGRSSYNFVGFRVARTLTP